ncbi:TPA_asm: tyrosin integrase [Methanobrevibacter gottschalkii virus vir075]|uniref:Phage integrase family protein n=1 Tax=Methanobrevibacter gottschalkii TaxID=190974 RepID=A0A1H7I310_9EURY|nr:tyrosine-type recombinase/integrase [Methanobrevibacter gottschalkii]SEK56936.1 Phage integrase family protein [Methanobrevibacter gottschalkii]
MRNKITTMNTIDILNQFSDERNHSTNTRYAYLQSIRIFEKYTETSLRNIMYLAEQDQINQINWKNQSLRLYLINFRKYLYDKYKINAAKQHLSRVIAVFRHYEITIEKLPYFSIKHATPSIPINPDLMIDREILKLCINIKNPLLKSITLFMSSSGMSKTDTLKLTVQDFLDATSEYHNTNNISDALSILKDNTQIIGYWDNNQRSKTGEIYYTFNSNESSTAIVQYLLTREKLTLESPLFDISSKYLSDLFKETNDKLRLGCNGQYSRFTAHMLRRYHATQLVEAGMDTEKINILQGRKPKSIAYKSYIKIKPSKLKQEYIAALPFLVVEDLNKVKTELDVTKEKNNQLETKVAERDKIINDYESILSDIDVRINEKIKEAMGNRGDDLDDLFV